MINKDLINKDLIKATQRGDIAKVKLALESGWSPNSYLPLDDDDDDDDDDCERLLLCIAAKVIVC